MEISHRSKEFIAVMEEAQSLVKELLNVPEGYHVLFLGGGARMQFVMAPYNLLKTKAVYVNTGSWAKTALKEAKCFGEVVEIVNQGNDYTYLPDLKKEDIPADADYIHITSNNTIFGTEIFEDLDLGIPLVADMSSDIFSRPIDVSKYAIIYGGAQKNLAPSGVAFVIIREDVLGKVDRVIPEMLDYKAHIAKGSMLNTPPVTPIYSALQTLKWIKELGGVTELNKMNKEKAALLYNEIDRNKLFKGTVAIENRSIMNICFIMEDKYKDLEKEFFDFATSKGMIGIKGHRSVGGFRASTYNALPKESVEALIAVMQEFEKSKA
jgi:phosphoserine aminotransferase